MNDPDPQPAHRAQRGRHLLDHARFMTLATTDGSHAWACTLNYVALSDPLRLLWYSMRDSRHSRNLATNPLASGSIFLNGLPGFWLDGAQFEGTAHIVDDDRVAEIHRRYYTLNFPDETIRKEWSLPLTQFTSDGPRRFYTLDISRWWLLDIDQWLIDKRDQCIPAPLP